MTKKLLIVLFSLIGFGFVLGAISFFSSNAAQDLSAAVEFVLLLGAGLLIVLWIILLVLRLLNFVGTGNWKFKKEKE